MQVCQMIILQSNPILILHLTQFLILVRIFNRVKINKIFLNLDLDEDLPRYNYELNRFDDSIRTDYQTDFQEICEINMRMRRSYYQKKNYKKPDYYQPYYRSN